MRVLLADANQERADSVACRLAETGLNGVGAVEIIRLQPGETLTAAVLASAAEIVIVDMARPDRDGLDSIREMSQRLPRPVVLFVDHDDSAFMEAAIAAGVSSYNVVGQSLPDVKPIVQTAVAMFRRYQQIETELKKSQASLQERMIIDRAKTLLIQQRQIGEPEAYRWLRRRAMDRGKRIFEIAQEIIAAGGHD